MYRDLLPQRPISYHVRSLSLLIFLPFLMFTSLVALSSFTFRIPGLTWGLAMVYLAICLLFMVVRQSRDGPRFWFHAGGLCFMATALGCTCGLWNYSRNTYKYWAYEVRAENKGFFSWSGPEILQ